MIIIGDFDELRMTKVIASKKRKRDKGKKKQNFRARRRPKSFSFSLSSAFFVLEEEIRKDQYFFSRGILGKNETQKLKFDTISHSQNQNQQGFSKSPAEVELQPLARLRGRPPAPWPIAAGELAAHAAGGQGRRRRGR